MSDETAREIAERETGRSDDRRETAERRANRAGEGRRRRSTTNPRSKPAKTVINPSTEPSLEGPPSQATGAVDPTAMDQRRFNRM